MGLSFIHLHPYFLCSKFSTTKTYKKVNGILLLAKQQGTGWWHCTQRASEMRVWWPPLHWSLHTQLCEWSPRCLGQDPEVSIFSQVCVWGGNVWDEAPRAPLSSVLCVPRVPCIAGCVPGCPCPPSAVVKAATSPWRARGPKRPGDVGLLEPWGAVEMEGGGPLGRGLGALSPQEA